MEKLTPSELKLLMITIREKFDNSDSEKESMKLVNISEKLNLPISNTMRNDHNIHEYKQI